MKVKVLIRPRNEVPDTAGELIKSRLVEIGYNEVTKARLGKLIDLELEMGDAQMANERVERMCSELLANGVIEEYEVLVDE